MDEDQRSRLLVTPIIALILGAILRDVSVQREALDVVADALITLRNVPSRGLSPLSPCVILVHSRGMCGSGKSCWPVRVVLEVHSLVHAALNLS